MKNINKKNIRYCPWKAKGNEKYSNPLRYVPKEPNWNAIISEDTTGESNEKNTKTD